MCGICGFFQIEREAGVDTLKKMNDRLVHRGPDDQGFYLWQGAGLAVRRLSVIDIQTGHQPLCSQSRNSWIAFNGEVYNFLELRRELIARGYVFRSQSDTEVVVNLYEEFGLEFAKKLRGMFAIALYDQKNNRLILARDPIGKKPLYYCLKKNGNLIFGSEIKAMLPYPGIDRAIHPEALDFFLTLEYVPAPYSILASVKKLPAGHMLVYENGKATVSEYWDVPCCESRHDFASAREEFLSLLEEAVRLRMVADVPLGAFLSGGIDSSAVVAMMAKISPSPVQTFSVGFEEKTYSELPYARAVAEKFNTIHNEKILRADIQDLVLQLAAGLDEPLADFSNFPTYLVAQAAREKVTVALSGDGGDEIFGGYEHYLAQKLARFIDASPLRPLRSLSVQAMRLVPPSAFKKGLVSRGKRFSEGLANSKVNRHFRWMLHLTAMQKTRLYSPEFQDDAFARDLPDREPFRTFFERSRRFSGINRDLYLDLKTYLADDIMVKVDRMTMAASLEARAPLLDCKLVEFAFSLPAHWKVRNGTGKWFFKKAMAGILDEEIIRRQKQGFSIPIKNWLKSDLRELLQETLAEKKIASMGFFNAAYVQTMIQEHLQNRMDHSHRLWALMQFQLWHDHYGRE